jgi:hypothetical protein
MSGSRRGQASARVAGFDGGRIEGEWRLLGYRLLHDPHLHRAFTNMAMICHRDDLPAVFLARRDG